MRPVEELADRLVEYDPRLARRVVALIVERLGGGAASAGDDLARLHAFLSRNDAAAVRDEPAKTTSEWKIDFAHYERLRLLGLLVADLLSERER